MLRKEYFVRGIILFLLALPLVLIPLSFSRYPDVVLYEAPGVTLADIDEYSDELGVAARLSNQVYITNPLYLEAMEIPFLIGSPYDTSAFDRGDQVIVVSGSYALAHFFTYDIIGESITVGTENYRVCGVFDDREYESFEEKSAGIDLAEMQFIPYTSIVGWQARKAESCIAAQELSSEATEVLSRTRAEDLTNYKTGLWRTSVMMVCVVLFLHGIVMTACSYKKRQIRTYAYMLLFVVAALIFIILWGTMSADAIPPSGRVWDVEYYGDLMVSKIQHVLDGQASVMERIYFMGTFELLFCGILFFVSIRLCCIYLHQSKQIRTVSLRRDCSGLLFLFWIYLLNVTAESTQMVTLGELLSNHGLYKAINHHVLSLSMVSMYYYRNHRHILSKVLTRRRFYDIITVQ